MFEWFDNRIWLGVQKVLSFRQARLKPYNGRYSYFSRVPNGIINALRLVYFFIYHKWSKSDGPRFPIKIFIVIMDGVFGQFYRLNKNPIHRSSKSSSILSNKQNIGGFQL